MKVFWTEAALSQLQAIYDYISHTSPDYASRMIDRLTKRSIQIAEFPYSGRMVPGYESNEVARGFLTDGHIVDYHEIMLI